LALDEPRDIELIPIISESPIIAAISRITDSLMVTSGEPAKTIVVRCPASRNTDEMLLIPLAHTSSSAQISVI
jgi:hypothetical protein